MRKDRMILSAFAQASTTKSHPGAWLHPGSVPDVTRPEYYINLARELDSAGWDMVFFDDRLAMPATFGGDFRAAVEKGTRVVKLDLIAILGLMAAHSSRIGLGATYSTTYYHPYHVARAFATLDHLSGGRAIWNIVTSLNQDEADNFGQAYIEHDQRYDRADEFLEVTTGLWDTWEREAYLLDRQSGVFADSSKVHSLDHKGEHFASKGPLTVPRTPQGWPTLLQAGQSGRGRQFAARWADLIFVIATTKEQGQAVYAEQHAAFAASGRTDPPGKILPAVSVIVAETTEIAKERKAYLEAIADPDEALIQWSEASGIDFAGFPADQPFPKDILEDISGSHAILKGVFSRLEAAYGSDPTPNDLRKMAVGRAGAGIGPSFIGNPVEIADQLCEWFESYACDGFVIGQTTTPGSFEEFGRYVIPELRRRGVFPELDEREPQSFRQRMGLGERG